MKFTIFLLGLLAVLSTFGCKKDNPDYTVTLAGIYATPNNDAFDYWLFIHDDDGAVLESAVIDLPHQTYDFSFSSDKLDGNQRYNVSFAAQNKATKYLTLRTFLNVPTGKKLVSAGYFYSGGNTTSYTSGTISIAGAPEIDYLKEVGNIDHEPLSVLATSPIFRAAVFAATGGSGIGLELKLKNDPVKRYYWLATPPNLALIQDTIPFSAFSAGVQSKTIVWPSAGQWGYFVAAVTEEGAIPTYGILTQEGSTSTLPTTSDVSFWVPSLPNVQAFWVSGAKNLATEEYQYVFGPNEPVIFPEINFGVLKLNYALANAIKPTFEGEIDAVEMRFGRTNGNHTWIVEGTPDQMATLTLPEIPSEVRQNWPSIGHYTNAKTECVSIQAIDSYEELYDLNPVTAYASTYWRAKQGWARRRQQW